MLMRSRDDNNTSSGGYWGKYSDASEYNMERRRDPKHNRRTTARTREESYAKSLSAQQSEEEEDFVQETPEAALVAATTYLLTTQPEPGDPREHMHQAAIRSLGLIEDKLMGKLSEEKATHHKERRDGWRVVDDDYGQTVGKLQAESMMSTAASLFPQ
jgi:hypothetical protein